MCLVCDVLSRAKDHKRLFVARGVVALLFLWRCPIMDKTAGDMRLIVAKCLLRKMVTAKVI